MCVLFLLFVFGCCWHFGGCGSAFVIGGGGGGGAGGVCVLGGGGE